MLPRSKLIPLKNEFGRIRQTGKLYDSSSFGLFVSYNKENKNDGAKAAFVISKKIDKKSTVRHKIKRKLADAVIEYLFRLPKTIELVFLAKQKVVLATPDRLKAEIYTVLGRAKLL